MDGWQLVADLLWASLALSLAIGAAGVVAAHRSRRGTAFTLLLASTLLLLAYSIVTGFSIGRFTVLLPLLATGYAFSMGRGLPAVTGSLVGSVVFYELCSWVLTPLVLVWPFGYLFGFWWEALELWGDDVARIEPLAGGVANDVRSVRVNGHLAVGRLGARSEADLAWETELLKHLDREGLPVPVPIPTTDGRLFAGGVVVMTYVEGGPPETEADWRRVADTLRQLHRLTLGWPQRPGWRSSTDLLHAETGTRIDLGAMPPEGVARCRAAWARLVGRQTCVVHGNPNNAGNVRMTADRVALIDWNESQVDLPDLDLVLPHNAAGLDDDAHDIAAQASAAWEAAICWDDEYAVKRLAEVRAV